MIAATLSLLLATIVPVRVGFRKQLLVDDLVIERRENVTRDLGKVTKYDGGKPVLVRDKPWEDDGFGFYGTVLHDAGKFRMWYCACHCGMNPDWPARKMRQVTKKPGWLIGVKEGFEVFQGPLCYAESDDGITREGVCNTPVIVDGIYERAEERVDEGGKFLDAGGPSSRHARHQRREAFNIDCSNCGFDCAMLGCINGYALGKPRKEDGRDVAVKDLGRRHVLSLHGLYHC